MERKVDNPWAELASGLMMGELEEMDEMEILEAIRQTDARMKLAQESYRARDMVINDTIRKAVLAALRRGSK